MTTIGLILLLQLFVASFFTLLTSTCTAETSKALQAMSRLWKAIEQNRFGLLHGLLCCGMFLGLTTWLMRKGVDMIEMGKELQESATIEKCLLVDYDAVECTYSCNCDTDGNNCASTCHSTRYLYSATVESKCGNETIFQRDDDRICPGDLIKLNTEKTCYVLDCEKREFTFYSHSVYIGWGVTITVVSSLLYCCGLSGICAGIRMILRKKTTDQSGDRMLSTPLQPNEENGDN